MPMEVLCMQNFKKSLKSSIVFIVCLLLVFSFIVFPCFQNGSDYNDTAARQKLSGEINYIFSGASHALAAFKPDVVDEKLNVCSWNLSTSSASLNGRKTLLEKELSRNKVDTVIIDISFDTLLRSQKNENATGEPMIICKLDNSIERFRYLIENVSLFNGDYENVTSILLRYGLKAWVAKLSGKFGTLQKNKGFMPDPSVDVSLSKDSITSAHKINKLQTDYLPENIEALNQTIELCKSYGANVILAVVPISEARIWKYTGWDKFLEEIKKISDQNNCVFLDFNLIRNRFEVFDDKCSFNNETHLSETGAEAFSEVFSAIILKMNNGEDISNLFYSSYDDMIANSIYNDYLNN